MVKNHTKGGGVDGKIYLDILGLSRGEHDLEMMNGADHLIWNKATGEGEICKSH